MVVKFFPFSKYHNKGQVGSSTIRVDNVIKYWDEASEYKYGDYADVMIFQKVYIVDDFPFIQQFDKKKILDICDPDWLDGAQVKRTIDAVDAVTTSSPELQRFCQQLTDKPVVHIPDRFDLEIIPPAPPHRNNGKAKKLVWFGYAQNAETLFAAIPALVKREFEWTIISNEDPHCERYVHDKKDADKVQYIKYDESTIYQELQKHDICVLPQGFRAKDKFKSNNKTIKANLAGLPVAKDDKDIEKLIDPVERQSIADMQLGKARADYDVKKSVLQYKELIESI